MEGTPDRIIGLATAITVEAQTQALALGVSRIEVAEIVGLIYRARTRSVGGDHTLIPTGTRPQRRLWSAIDDEIDSATDGDIDKLAALRIVRADFDHAAEVLISEEMQFPLPLFPFAMPILLTAPAPADDALRIATARRVVPLDIGSAEIRRRLGPGFRGRGVFSARTNSARYLTGVKRAAEALLEGRTNLATMRLALSEVLTELGYTPEGGFPGEGEAPEAVRGTLQDLSSRRRLDLVLRTQVALMHGAGLKARGEQPGRLGSHPFWSFVRMGSVEAPRAWRDRWLTAGGLELEGGALAAPKGDPVWSALGDSDLFDDALDTEHPPFAFNSQMGWSELSRREGEALGLDPAAAKGTPPGVALEDELPRPKAPTAKIDPLILAQLKAEVAALDADGALDYNPAIEQGGRN